MVYEEMRMSGWSKQANNEENIVYEQFGIILRY